MREKFINWAKIICNNESILHILENLKQIFEKKELYHEMGACVEKIWHITHEDNLYEEVGDIFLYKVKNREIANAAYNEFLRHTMPDFYKKYSENLVQMGINCINTEPSDDNLSPEIIDLCDRFDVIVFMMICLHKNSDFEGIFILNDYLCDIRNKINEYRNSHQEEDASYVKDIKNTECHLSEILSETLNHNDINKLAINLNKNNKRAYFNITEDLIEYKNYNDAIDFYNNNICTNFEYDTVDEIINLCWKTSDFYRNIYEFYPSVLMQKYALELDIKGEKNA